MGCKLLEEDISVLRHWGDCMKKAKAGTLQIGEIKSDKCMWCQKYNTLVTMEIGKPGDPCTLDCPIRFYAGKSGCVGSPWHDVADKLSELTLHIARYYIEPNASILPQFSIQENIYQETKRMFLFIVEAIRKKRKGKQNG